MASDPIAIPGRKQERFIERRQIFSQLDDLVDAGCERRLSDCELATVDMLIRALNYECLDDYIIGSMYNIDLGMMERCLSCIRYYDRIVHAALSKERFNIAQLIRDKAFCYRPSIRIRNDQVEDIILNCLDCEHLNTVIVLFGSHLSNADTIISAILEKFGERKICKSYLRILAPKIRSYEVMRMLLERVPWFESYLVPHYPIIALHLNHLDLHKLQVFASESNYSNLAQILNREQSIRGRQTQRFVNL